MLFSIADNSVCGSRKYSQSVFSSKLNTGTLLPYRCSSSGSLSIYWRFTIILYFSINGRNSSSMASHNGQLLREYSMKCNTAPVRYEDIIAWYPLITDRKKPAMPVPNTRDFYNYCHPDTPAEHRQQAKGGVYHVSKHSANCHDDSDWAEVDPKRRYVLFNSIQQAVSAALLKVNNLSQYDRCK